MTDAPKESEAKAAERRRHTRFQPHEVTISLVQPSGLLKVFGGKGDNVAHSILDLSEGGMRVTLTKRVVVGRKVNIEFSVKKFQDKLSLSGDVLWLAQHPVAEGLFIIGIRFEKVAIGQEKIIGGWRSYFTSPAAKQRETTRKSRQEPS